MFSACAKQHEPVMEFVVIVSKEPQAVITSSGEPFSKITHFSFYMLANVLSAVCLCVLRGFSGALALRGPLQMWLQTYSLNSFFYCLGFLMHKSTCF